MSLQKESQTACLLDESRKSLLYTTVRPEIIMERGEGMFLWDTEGNKYLDFIGGWAVTCLGHSPAVIRKALEYQASTLVHASPYFLNKPMIELAKLLTDISCFDRVFFASSGSEANESAIKLARKYGSLHLDGAYEIITNVNSFHGRTLTTMAATGKKPWEQLFAPKTPGFVHVPLNDLDACLAAINSNTCAIMLELIQGEGGVHTVDPLYLRQLRSKCDELGIMLIFDEIQTGLARTGKLFAYEHYGVEADIMTLGKGIGGGFPLSAMLAKDAYNIFDSGDQGGTYTGQPLAMAVGLAVVQEIMDRELHHNAEQQGNYILACLHQIADTYNLQHIRGKGLLLAFDLPQAIGTELVAACLEEGLIINAPNPLTIRLIPPLIVSKEDIDSMLILLVRALNRL